MSSSKRERNKRNLISLAAISIVTILGAALYSSSLNEPLKCADTEAFHEDESPQTPISPDDEDVSIPLNPDVFATPVKKRPERKEGDIFHSPRTTFIVESLENYAEIFDTADELHTGLILKDVLIEELKKSPILHDLTVNPEDPIRIVINRIQTSRPECISKQEWLSFCTLRVSKPDRKSKGLIPEDFRAVLDTVD